MEETKQKSGDAPAFASVACSVSGDVYCQEGLTIREYYAAKAMQGIMANTRAEPTKQEHFYNIADDAVRCADALIRALAIKSEL